jgi:hypothetical protein
VRVTKLDIKFITQFSRVFAFPYTYFYVCAPLVDSKALSYSKIVMEVTFFLIAGRVYSATNLSCNCSKISCFPHYS